MRRPAAVVLTLLTVLTTLAAVAPVTTGAAPSERRARAADRPLTGLAIPRTRRAGSGWIGARRLGRSVVYRTDPARRGSSRVFAPARTTGDYRASGGARVGPARTACAALLLGRYGVPVSSSSARDRRLQAAAVDVAVQHLLHGRGYRHDGRAQRRRTDQLEVGPLVRAYAGSLVEEQCPLAGPYRVRLDARAPRVDLGDLVEHTLTIRSHSGAPVAGTEVRVRSGDGAAHGVRTDEAGRVAFAVQPQQPGPFTTTVTTPALPPSQVSYRAPRRAGASRVVLAGRRLGDADPRSSTVAVRGLPTLRLVAVGPVTRGRPFRASFGLDATYPGRRTATVRVFGPLEPGPRCEPDDLRRRGLVAVVDDGTYRTEPITLRRRGAYAWQVVVPGDTYNQPVARCGGGFRVR